MSDYVELLEDARDALRAVLKMTEPGTGITLHHAYAELTQSIEKETRTTQPPPSARTYNRPPDWKCEIPLQDREREVLDTLSRESLTKREVLDRVRAAHPDLTVDLSTTDSIVTRLYGQRELDRSPEPAANGRPRYRYFKRTELDGAIADLDRAFKEETS